MSGRKIVRWCCQPPCYDEYQRSIPTKLHTHTHPCSAEDNYFSERAYTLLICRSLSEQENINSSLLLKTELGLRLTALFEMCPSHLCVLKKRLKKKEKKIPSVKNLQFSAGKNISSIKWKWWRILYSESITFSLYLVSILENKRWILVLNL